MVRSRKLFLGVLVGLLTGITLVIEVQLALKFHRIDSTVWGISALLGVVLLLGWYTLKPPRLKADASKVSLLDGLDTKRMLRSDLAFIFRGQLLRPVKGGSYWDKSYIFAGSDGTVWLQPWAESFTDDGVGEFAQRLAVPIRGDFSVKVKDRVDPEPIS